MWKIQASIALVIAVVGLGLVAFAAPGYSGSGMRNTGQVLAGVGGLLAVWITIKRFLFGITGD